MLVLSATGCVRAGGCGCEPIYFCARIVMAGKRGDGSVTKMGPTVTKMGRKATKMGPKSDQNGPRSDQKGPKSVNVKAALEALQLPRCSFS